jgi:serine/threonine protein phosphatase PrpC
MSMHSKKPELRRGIGLTTLSILGGLLLAFQFVLPSVAFASSPEHTAPASLTPQGVLDLTGVSVVRLVVNYTATTTNVPAECTGLGTLVESWTPGSVVEGNNWVLTDGTLVNQKGQTCVGTVRGLLTSITLFANNAYTNNKLEQAQIGQLQCHQETGQQALCSDSMPESLYSAPDGAVLLSFHTDAAHLQPFLGVAPQAAGTMMGIELASNSSSTATWPSKPALLGTAGPLTYLSPKFFTNTAGSNTTATGTPGSGSLSTTATSEPGMPLVDSNGNLVGMSLSGGASLNGQAIVNLLNQQAVVPAQQSNTLNSSWERGIMQYEAGDYVNAEATLKQIAGANVQFQAPLVYEGKAAAQIAHGNGRPGSTTGGGNTRGAGGTPSLSGILLIVGIIAGLLLLILLLVLVTVWAKRRQEMARFEAERAAAQHDAERDAQQIQRSKATINLQQPGSELSCPNCGAMVHATDPTCPKCGYLLSPSESGKHLRASPPQAEPELQPQANYVQSLGVATPSISEMPTMEYSPANGLLEAEKTLPYSIQQLQGRNLSLAVGHLTDPGIKRKHKPNEDSLFAVQGARTSNAQPQQFGLFVVADGMGGHANGQDASRLAIQTIIDYMLPTVSSGKQGDDEAFLNLLREGVQCANQAVHQRNLEERADMGTTMTAALVVGAMAYVANVGDSRTYLYREHEGLTKITHDHSVVASLVEAGIIKPDDIYTHPKRNQIYRSLGEKPVVDVDAFMVPLQAGDKLLLCSDGLWDMVRDPEIQRLMSMPAPDPMQTGRDLIQAALDGGGEDNVSVIVVYVTEATGQTGMSGVKLLAKPESVTVPDLP